MIVTKHAKQRAKERLGIDLTPERIKELSSRLQDGRGATRVRGGWAYTVTMLGKSLQCIVSADNGTIVTITEPKWKQNRRRAGRLS